MSFVFRNRMLNLNIAGNEFEIEIDAKNNEIMARLGPQAIDTAKAYQEGEKTEDKAINDFKGYINEALYDDGAFDKIFKSRTPDLRDCMDILTYIANEIGDFNQKNALATKKDQKVIPMPLN